MTDLTVAPERVVSIHYTLTDATGNVLDASGGGDPLPYLHGAGNIVVGLEKQLAGRAVGDRFDAVVSAAEGYGERLPGSATQVDRAAFPPGLKLAEGMQFATQGPDGEAVPLWITAISGETVTVDAQHPLAGVELHFAIEVVAVRAATADELSHGHPHGLHGHEGH